MQKDISNIFFHAKQKHKKIQQTSLTFFFIEVEFLD